MQIDAYFTGLRPSIFMRRAEWEHRMNKGFLDLPEERQRSIINAGFQVFAQNSYKKAHAAEIASVAGISKALLFYHFKNKKELYLYLWNKSFGIVARELDKAGVMKTNDYFEMLHRSLVGKCNVMRLYPYAMEFALRVYYEKDPDVAGDIQHDFEQVNRQAEKKVLDRIDKSPFRDGIDFAKMYQEMVWAADGYMRNAMMQGRIDPDLLEKDFDRLIIFWKSMYLR